MNHPTPSEPALAHPYRGAPVAAFLLLLAALLSGCAHGPGLPPGGAPAAAPSPAATPGSAASLGATFPSDVAAVPPHTGTVVYEAVQPDPSKGPRDIILILYQDRKAALLDRVIGDPTTPFTIRDGTWALSDAGSVRLYLDEKGGGELQLLLKRGEGYLTGDGTRFGGGILYLREI